MADKAYITPKVLKWARESARISIIDAAKKINIKPEKLNSWEEGVEHPTIAQAQNLAKLYKRSFAIFFLPEPPTDFQPLQDYRRDNFKPLSTASIFMIREVQQRQAWISELFAENGEEALSFVGKFSINDSPSIVANDILSLLGINPLAYKNNNPIKNWIDCAEKKGIFISKSSYIHPKLKLDSDELKGFAISDKYAPFVFVNSDDWNAPQLFTLVHEIAHIWIAQSGISNTTEVDVRMKDNLHPVELFCNQVAALALIPDVIIKSLTKENIIDKSTITHVTKKLGISYSVLLVRALNAGLINYVEYQGLKRKADKDFKAYIQAEELKLAERKEKKSGGPNFYLLQVGKNSRLFTQIVLDAYRGGRIEPTQASRLLNVKTNNFYKLEAFIK
ncbi:XRE family transcriptional regulator [Larkinella sp. VNQ87]|uniref:XRE family transcriptional regulator n=1 Tax=Larkinella sp. VNQ87 TaxID=3400921 RepID=UPI003C004893